MGVVYEATQLSLNRTIALKLLAANLGDDPAFRERFRREGLLQAAIDHPNIVTVYEAGDTDQGLFLAMRLVRGPAHAYDADSGPTRAPGEKILTETGQFVGTLDYISPEQIRGQGASAKSDIYALAAVLYECLTGIVPYPKDSE